MLLMEIIRIYKLRYGKQLKTINNTVNLNPLNNNYLEEETAQRVYEKKTFR